MAEVIKQIGHYIGGKLVPGAGQRSSKVFNPTTGEITGLVALGSEMDVANVVENSKRAFRIWSTLQLSERVHILFRYKELLEKKRDQLALIMCVEGGKTFFDAQIEITRGLEVLEFACGIPHLLKGDFSANVRNAVDCYSVRQPLGVCVGVTPFNFPVMVPMWMYPISIACGNTFILKPSEEDPSASIFLAELLIEAGAPEGVLNILNGDKTTVEILLSHPDIEAVSFVGSTSAASDVYHLATTNNLRVQALGGAKNHMVVLPDADIDRVVGELISAAYGSAGQRCMSISVVVAVGVAGELLIEKLVPRIRALRIGPPTDTETQMGPLISAEAHRRVSDFIALGLKEGAELIIDGRNIKPEGYKNGYFIGASLFDKVTPEMSIYKEEIFGPVLVILRTKNYADALELINTHSLGNGAVIFTSNNSAARDFAARTKVGMIGINVSVPVPPAFYSFGGWKNSLFGDHSVYGMEGVHFYTRLKTITSRW